MTTEASHKHSRQPDGQNANVTEPRGSAPAKAKKAAKPARGRKSTSAANQNPTLHDGPRLFAFESRVDLLPPEVRAGRRNEAIAHRMMLGLVVVIALIIAGIGGSTVLAVQARTQLQAAQSRTGALLAQQQKFGAVRQIQNEIKVVQAGQQVGGSTEIEWTAFLNRVQSTIGGGLVMTGMSLDSASPLAAYQQSAAPLQEARVATVTIDVTASSLDEIPPWLGQLALLNGVADVSPGPVTLVSGPGGGYTASAIMHLDKTAYDGRFAAKGK
jgi:hypothetical protein